MQNVLGNFIKAPNENGNILLVNMPPGTGKTYASSSAIARHVRSGDPRRVIFITPYKKNLPLDYYDEEGNRRDGELRKAFAREGIPELYDEYVINLQPVAEHVLRAGAEMLRNGDSELLRSFLDDRRFYNEIEAHFRLALEQGGSKRQFDMMVENFRLLENQLRRRIHRRLDSVGKKASERHQYIVDELPWLRDLYPEVDVYEKKVILLSSSKFIYPFDPIIAPSGSFYESDLLRDSVIFMDEFDSIKLDWLNNLVNRDNRRRIDLVNLYTRIHRGLMNRGNHARQYYRDADAGREGFTERDGLAFIADNVAEAFRTDFETHNLQYDFKLMDEGPGGFIFHDYNTITIGRSSKMDIETDGDERINGIVYREGMKGVSGIEVMFRDLDRRIRYFEGFVSRMARNYMENRSRQGSPVTYEHAIRTVLEPYALDADQVDYLVEAVMFRSGKRRLNADRSDMTVYARGFNYYDFEDDDTHGLNTHIHQTAYYRSPEAVLLRVLDTDGVKVIGVSATATLRTCVRNFDLRYLSYQSEFREYVPSEEETASLDAAYAKAMENYGDVNIVPIVIGSDYERCFENSKNVLKLFKMDLMREESYDLERYGRFAMAYRQFVRNGGIRSMLCFMTALPSKYGGLKEDVLRRICNAILVDEALEPTHEGPHHPEAQHRREGLRHHDIPDRRRRAEPPVSQAGECRDRPCELIRSRRAGGEGLRRRLPRQADEHTPHHVRGGRGRPAGQVPVRHRVPPGGQRDHNRGFQEIHQGGFQPLHREPETSVQLHANGFCQGWGRQGCGAGRRAHVPHQLQEPHGLRHGRRRHRGVHGQRHLRIRDQAESRVRGNLQQAPRDGIREEQERFLWH